MELDGTWNWNLPSKNVIVEIWPVGVRGVYVFVSWHPQWDPLFFKESKCMGSMFTELHLSLFTPRSSQGHAPLYCITLICVFGDCLLSTNHI